jgi:hypothetical protein
MKPNKLPWMKTRLPALGLIAALLSPGHGYAQQPDCTTGTVMYAIFNDSIGSTSTVHKQSEIRPVTYATGAIGALMGSTTYLISKTISGTTYYGSAGTGVDVVTKRFYAFTQMSGAGGAKDIYSINTLAATTVVIGTTPSALNAYHFVKVAISPTGVGYAVGVLDDTTSLTKKESNPLISFSTCGGTPSAGCATASITLLGYLDSMTNAKRWDLFNGDIAFDNAGDLYFATASFGKVGASTFGKYKDARLFRVAKANIPASAGSGLIPMTMVADYNTLDSTVINGIAMDPAGAMYIATRRYQGIQAATPPPFKNELYKSSTIGSATLMPGFAPITSGYSIADLASCYFPSVVLKKQEFTLAGSVNSGNSNLGWAIEDNTDVLYFEVQRSDGSPDKFATVNRVYPDQPQIELASYKYLDNVSTVDGAVFYRVRKVLNGGMGIYSNIVKLYNGSTFHMTAKPRPNPVVQNLDLDIQLRTAATVNVRMFDANGRLVRNLSSNQPAGTSSIHMNDLAPLAPGIYILEMNVAGESIKEKIIKR